jgi:cell wall-associated protease
VVGPTMVTPLPIAQTSPKYLAVFLAPSVPAPQPLGSTVVWTATPVGGTAAPLYKWLINNGNGWVAQGGWTTSNTFTWTPSSPSAKYRVSVWVKSATNTADAAEATTAFEYMITGLAQ